VAGLDGSRRAPPVPRAAGGVLKTPTRRWGTLAVIAAWIVWDEERWHTIAARQLRFCREAGSLAQMVISANTLAILTTFRGDFAAAASLVSEAEAVAASIWALPELIEAAGRTGQSRQAADALDRLAAATNIGQTDWGHGIYARCRALLNDGEDAEDWFRQAADRLSRTPLRPELARAHLLCGEWLRRERRRVDAREQLRTAHEMFMAMGAEAFAERAARELLATGERVRKRAVEAREQLTSQEVRWRGSPATASPIQRSRRGCSSAREPPSITSTRSSPNWGSARGTNSTAFSARQPAAAPAS
jgi:hypothetical protein